MVITELEKKMKKSPCYECEKRCSSCHDSCEDYISWNTERKMWIEAEKGDKLMSAYYAEHDIRWRKKHKHIL